jgi:undecaprenyl-diphosphatase
MAQQAFILAGMAADTDRTPILDRLGASPLRAVADRARGNVQRSAAFLARRRRDARFRIVPYNSFQVLNAAAILATLLGAFVFVLDPLLVAWQATLSGETVTFFEQVTRFGKSDWILVSTGIFVIVMLFRDASALTRRVRARRTAHSLAALYVFVSVASSGIIANIAKYVIGRARPEHFEISGGYSFDFWSGDADWASFPSGHATTAMALGLSLALLFPKLRWVFLSVGFWIAVSRLFVRAHYPSDVLVGCVLGALTAWLIARALAQRRLLFDFDKAGNLIRRRSASARLLG